MIRRSHVTVTRRCEPVLGSVLDSRVIATSRRRANAALNDIVDSIAEWEQRVSAYRSDSGLRRWLAGRTSTTSMDSELRSVLERAVHWERVTDGRVTPTPGSPGLVCELIAGDSIDRGQPAPVVQLDAFAKGLIVDRVIERAAERAGVVDVMIDVGGDIRAVGHVGVTVGVEHPTRPFDNEPPVGRFTLRNAACAVSGNSRRGDHILDGRTGEAISSSGSVIVVAGSLEVADAWATSLSVDPTHHPPVGVRWCSVDDDRGCVDPLAFDETDQRVTNALV